MTKTCSSCNISKPVTFEYFYRQPTGDGYHAACKDCHRVKNREYRNRPNVAAKLRDKKRQRYARPDVKQSYREYAARPEVREHRRKYCKRRYHTIPRVKALVRLNTLARIARRKSSDDKTVTLEAVRRMHREQNGQCNICSCTLTDKNRHLDHIYPLSRGGKHTISNVQWLCARCNLSKHTKLPSDVSTSVITLGLEAERD